MAEEVTCDLDHGRAVPASLMLEIKSRHAGKPGRPKMRVAAVCAAHARQLQKLGLGLLDSR
ncbi:MAG: hypothetical protein LC808_25660 [Actinobacteria bacterium]|nr:hypothetical protein [Actinomycetota bacterium]